MSKILVGIVMGSDSDLEVMKEAGYILDKFSIGYEMNISLTPLPVIGVPMHTQSLGGIDSLLSTAQMPSGVPVATMAIGKAGAKNAAILAAQILGAKCSDTRVKVIAYKKEIAEQVMEKNKRLCAENKFYKVLRKECIDKN
jgi:phosphoribosylcarboxyaminoimidazole (NCAIR) mutase